jgi:ferric iron reductase protein FhuF
MKTRLAFDTSALVSLGTTDLPLLIVDHYLPVVTPSVLVELAEINRRGDCHGRASGIWLELSDFLMVDSNRKLNTAEEELISLCQQKGLILIIDDIRATRKIPREVTWYFSTHFVYALFTRGLISKERGKRSVEEMRIARSWRANKIALAGMTLFD